MTMAVATYNFISNTYSSKIYVVMVYDHRDHLRETSIMVKVG